MHGYEIQADPKLQQTCRYIFLCYAFTKIASRASESKRAYNLVNEHASKFSKLVEDILCSEMDGNVNEKDHELPFEELQSSTNKECVQDVDIVKATRFKRRPWIGKKKSNNRPSISQTSLVILLIKLVYISSLLQVADINKCLIQLVYHMQVPTHLFHMINNTPCSSVGYYPYYHPYSVSKFNLIYFL